MHNTSSVKVYHKKKLIILVIGNKKKECRVKKGKKKLRKCRDLKNVNCEDTKLK